MSAIATRFDAFMLPWDRVREDNRRLRRWLLLCGAAAVLMGTVIPWLPLPDAASAARTAAPPPITQIVLERPQPVIPPPPPPPPAATRAEPPPPAPAPRAPTAAAEPAPPAPIPAVDPRERAAAAGLLAFSDALADMRNAVDTEQLQDTRAARQGGGAAATVDRSLLTTTHTERSSGVNLAELSRETGGVALAGRETTRVEAPAGSAAPADPRTSGAASADPRLRSIEDVRKVFDANKGAIFAIYNRSLRTDPALRGQLVLELVIEPAGHVSEVRVVSSELADEELLSRLLGRIRMFDFGAGEVGQTRITYPVHFLPS